MNGKIKWKNKHSFSRHWTESDNRVIEFLEETFKDPPIRPDFRCGYDYLVGDSKIEVKSCQEWIKSRGANGRGSKGKRRRGRFHFDKGTIADMILFVLVRESGGLDFAIRFPEQFDVINLSKTKIINWGDIFTQCL
jgi:hypothetical protein